MLQQGPIEKSFIVAEFHGTMVLLFKGHYYIVTVLEEKRKINFVHPNIETGRRFGLTPEGLSFNGIYCDNESLAIAEFNKMVEDMKRYL